MGYIATRGISPDRLREIDLQKTSGRNVSAIFGRRRMQQRYFVKNALATKWGAWVGEYIDKWSVLFQHFPLLSCPPSRSVAYIRFLQLAGPISIVAFKLCFVSHVQKYRTIRIALKNWKKN